MKCVLMQSFFSGTSPKHDLKNYSVVFLDFAQRRILFLFINIFWDCVFFPLFLKKFDRIHLATD